MKRSAQTGEVVSPRKGKKRGRYRKKHEREAVESSLALVCLLVGFQVMVDEQVQVLHPVLKICASKKTSKAGTLERRLPDCICYDECINWTARQDLVFDCSKCPLGKIEDARAFVRDESFVDSGIRIGGVRWAWQGGLDHQVEL